MNDDNIILSHGSDRGTKVLSYAGEHGYIYEVKGRTLTVKTVLSHLELIAAIDQYITENS